MFHVIKNVPRGTIKKKIMKKYLVEWRTKTGEKFSHNEVAESLKKAIKQVAYFEKKTGYELIGIKEIENEEEA